MYRAIKEMEMIKRMTHLHGKLELQEVMERIEEKVPERYNEALLSL